MSNKVRVYIEIEKWSSVKYEYNKEYKSLDVDRILPAPFMYPQAYGFIPNTLAADGDDLDALILYDELSIQNDCTYDAYIVGALRMEDEKGMDEKVLCTLDDTGVDITDLDPETLEEIEEFFSHYKSKCSGKWSKTNGFMNKAEAVALYESCKLSPA